MKPSRWVTFSTSGEPRGCNNANGPQAIPAGLEADRDRDKRGCRMEVPEMREAMQKTRGTIRHPQTHADGRTPQPHPGGYTARKPAGNVRTVSFEVRRTTSCRDQEEQKRTSRKNGGIGCVTK